MMSGDISLHMSRKEIIAAIKEYQPWRDVLDAPTPGERVIFDTGSFVGEGYTSESGVWYRYGFSVSCDIEQLLGKVIRWKPLPKSLNNKIRIGE